MGPLCFSRRGLPAEPGSLFAVEGGGFRCTCCDLACSCCLGYGTTVRPLLQPCVTKLDVSRGFRTSGVAVQPLVKSRGRACKQVTEEVVDISWKLQKAHQAVHVSVCGLKLNSGHTALHKAALFQWLHEYIDNAHLAYLPSGPPFLICTQALTLEGNKVEALLIHRNRPSRRKPQSHLRDLKHLVSASSTSSTLYMLRRFYSLSPESLRGAWGEAFDGESTS